MESQQKYDKFRESQQAAVKLQIAAERFFMESEPEQRRAVYGAYLKQRIRPAMELLIRQENLQALETLYTLGWLPLGQIDDFLEMAAEAHKNSALIWLLKLKNKTLGFAPRDLSL